MSANEHGFLWVVMDMTGSLIALVTAQESLDYVKIVSFVLYELYLNLRKEERMHWRVRYY